MTNLKVAGCLGENAPGDEHARKKCGEIRARKTEEKDWDGSFPN